MSDWVNDERGLGRIRQISVEPRATYSCWSCCLTSRTRTTSIFIFVSLHSVSYRSIDQWNVIIQLDRIHCSRRKPQARDFGWHQPAMNECSFINEHEQYESCRNKRMIFFIILQAVFPPQRLRLPLWNTNEVLLAIEYRRWFQSLSRQRRSGRRETGRADRHQDRRSFHKLECRNENNKLTWILGPQKLFTYDYTAVECESNRWICNCLLHKHRRTVFLTAIS